MRAQVREITARSNGWSLAYVVVALRRYLLGWQAYFRLAETPSVFAGLDGWIRRRLRALLIYQCRHGHKLFRVLRARGVPTHAAASAARHSRRYWAIAAHLALSIAFPTQYFETLGVPRLGPA
jgi:RNA-directed DNA polymerase